MTQATYSDQLLEDITRQRWRDEELDLSDHKLTDLQLKVLCKAVIKNPYIKSLKLANCQISDKGAQIVAALTLPKLDLSLNNIGPQGALALAANTTFTFLNINWNKVGVLGAGALAKHTTLTELFISHNALGPEGAALLASNTRLVTLNLGTNDIGDEGLSALANNKTLKKLYVYWNKITDHGACAIAAHEALNFLDLSANDIGDQGALALLNNDKLTYLNLGVNIISQQITDHVIVRPGLLYSIHLQRQNGESIQALLAAATTKTPQPVSAIPAVPPTPAETPQKEPLSTLYLASSLEVELEIFEEDNDREQAPLMSNRNTAKPFFSQKKKGTSSPYETYDAAQKKKCVIS